MILMDKHLKKAIARTLAKFELAGLALIVLLVVLPILVALIIYWGRGDIWLSIVAAIVVFLVDLFIIKSAFNSSRRSYSA